MSATRQSARIEMMEELKRFQADLTESWIDQSLPSEWDGLEATHPVARPKTRVTLRLDTDMVKWFRRLGPGYGARINLVLRIYWAALVAGQVKAHWDEETTAPRFDAYLERRVELLMQQRQREGR
ncbi:BrnA antitoxin family protein [Thalassovita taeanensis]|mgnify:CR=1 FL=1|uniref:BrnA antitoxin of type II toxin-antitoxin system n=1 Tax=Thalassovita taeanensis TaxID=657014 RepID=A0A1H9FSC4_9RHOB|nr:BrnA antitoxin family protein [Thalassovita taeanensis]SEQ40378.1 BrnA antitoxin of type II toxin-antitoxin system [Thalassovita taeanensis]